MKFSQMIEGKYLAKEDVDGELIVTIEKYGKVNVAREDQPEELKPAVRFREFKKPMVLNTTNVQVLKQIFNTDNTDETIGKQVVIYVDPNVSFQGKLIGGLRLKANRPAASPQQASVGGSSFDDMKDDIPF